MWTGGNLESQKSDPLRNPAFKEPGLLDGLREIFFGARRLLDCAQIEVTSHCMGHCIYCPHTSQKQSWKSRHMDAEIFARLWPLLRLCKRAHLQGWGEPLLQPRFFDFVALARKAGCQVSTTTCGLTMKPEDAEKIAESGIDMIAFSLSGTDEDSNSARAGISLARTAEAVRILGNARKDNMPEIHIAYLLLADRMDAVKKLPELMNELNVEMAVVSTLDYLAAPADKALAFQPWEHEKTNRAKALLEEAKNEAAKNGKIIHFALPGEKPVAHGGGCRENILKSLYIDADGNISPCVYLNVPGSDDRDKRRVFGNVRESEIMDIWRSLEFASFRNSLLEDRPDSACLGCPKRYEIELG